MYECTAYRLYPTYAYFKNGLLSTTGSYVGVGLKLLGCRFGFFKGNGGELIGGGSFVSSLAASRIASARLLRINFVRSMHSACVLLA